MSAAEAVAFPSKGRFLVMWARRLWTVYGQGFTTDGRCVGDPVTGQKAKDVAPDLNLHLGITPTTHPWVWNGVM